MRGEAVSQPGTQGPGDPGPGPEPELYGSTTLARVVSNPYVSKAVEAATPYVPLNKDSALVDRLNALYAAHAERFVERHADTLKRIDRYAYKQLDTVEKIAGSLREQLSSVSSEVNTRAAKVEHTMLAPTNAILDRADAFLDTILPEDDDSTDDESGDDDSTETSSDNRTKSHDSSSPSSSAGAGAGDKASPLPKSRPASTSASATRNQRASCGFGREARHVAARTREFSHRVQIRAFTRALRELQLARDRCVSAIRVFEPQYQPVLEFSEQQYQAWKPTIAQVTDKVSAVRETAEQRLASLSPRLALISPVDSNSNSNSGSGVNKQDTRTTTTTTTTTSEPSFVSMKDRLRRPIDRSLNRARDFTAAGTRLVAALVSDLDAHVASGTERASSLLRTAASTAAENKYAAQLTSKAGDLIVSAQQTQVYAQVSQRVLAIANHPRTAQLSDTVIGYLDRLGLTVPDAIRSRVPSASSSSTASSSGDRVPGLSYAAVAARDVGAHNDNTATGAGASAGAGVKAAAMEREEADDVSTPTSGSDAEGDGSGDKDDSRAKQETLEE